MANLEQDKLKFEFPQRLKMISLVLVGIGLALTITQVFVPWHGEGGGEHGNPRLYISILLALLVALPLSLGGIYFTALHHASGAAWSVTVRRIAENYFWFLPFCLIALAVVFVGLGDAYHHWVGKTEDPVIAWKSAYLNTSFFIGRNTVILILWTLFGFLFWKKSTNQDLDGNVSHTKSMIKWSAGFLVVFCLTLSVNSWDLSMSLEPHWFSTMWAVYIFAGLALTTFASLILWVNYLKGQGLLGNAVNENHIHDMGKYLWGHTIFWGYIMICQYLLIWYGMLPEETIFYHKRMFDVVDGNLVFNTWAIFSLALVVVRFAIPFFALLKRENKRNIKFLSVIAWIVILGQILDMYWVAYPTLQEHGEFVMFSWQEIGTLMLLGGAYIFVVGSALSRKPLVPVKDPKLEECLHMHH
ncbi:MAG: hypothetical protein KDK37_05580 [Leptospiraceae bacterium]|nr:hypothetical protein [Leptospiraceae bacterium]